VGYNAERSEGEVMSDSGNRAVMEGYLRALVDRADFDRFFAPDVMWTTMETGEQVHGREAVRDLIVALHTQIFDGAPEVVGLITADDAAVLEARFVGRHTGALGDLAPTGRDVNFPYCVVYDIADGTITALRAYVPMAALIAQLTGATESAGASA
jgi:predicted ester cyclase